MGVGTLKKQGTGGCKSVDGQEPAGLLESLACQRSSCRLQDV